MAAAIPFAFDDYLELVDTTGRVTVCFLAHRHATIRAVYLRGSNIRCKDDVLPPYFDKELDLTPQFRGRPGSKIDVLGFQNQPDAAQHRIAICHFQVGVRLVDNASLTTTDPVDDEAVYLEITADFSAEYDIRDGIDDATLRPALGAAFRAGGVFTHCRADALLDGARSAGAAVVLGAVVGCAAQDGACGVRVPGTAGAGVGSPGAVTRHAASPA